MSSSDRRTILALLVAVSLAACGFTPAYGPGGSARGLLGQVTVDAPSDKDAFDLVERLEERLGRTRQPNYQLGYRITITTQEQAITPDNAINRYQVVGVIAYSLRNSATGKVLTSGSVNSFTAYSAVGSSVATVSSEADARTRLMRLLADQIVTRLIATSPKWNDA